MKLDADLAAFLASPVMIIIGTSDDSGRPEIARAVGARIDADARRRRIGGVGMAMACHRSPICATAGASRSPSQGRRTTSRTRSREVPASGRPAPRTWGSLRRYMAAIVEVLAGLGLDRRLAAPWVTAREAVVARIRVDAVYVQTPGVRAGQELATP